jgi:hypothetical protein
MLLNYADPNESGVCADCGRRTNLALEITFGAEPGETEPVYAGPTAYLIRLCSRHAAMLRVAATMVDTVSRTEAR